MSLTVSLELAIEQKDTVPVRVYDAQGRERELTRAEWSAAFPHYMVVDDYPASETVYSSNVTGNLGKMAREAGLYEVLWCPDEHGITAASQLIEPLRTGIERLKTDPARFKLLSSPNGWGTYEQFIPWLLNYLNACEQFPDASVWVSK